MSREHASAPITAVTASTHGTPTALRQRHHSLELGPVEPRLDFVSPFQTRTCLGLIQISFCPDLSGSSSIHHSHQKSPDASSLGHRASPVIGSNHSFHAASPPIGELADSGRCTAPASHSPVTHIQRSVASASFVSLTTKARVSLLPQLFHSALQQLDSSTRNRFILFGPRFPAPTAQFRPPPLLSVRHPTEQPCRRRLAVLSAQPLQRTMARERDGDSASTGGDGQSKHRDSDTQSDVSFAAPHQHRHKQPHQKQHHVGGGRLHARVPSSKVLHTKSHQHGQAAPRLTRRTTSPGDRESTRRPNNHRRVHSEAKISRDSSSANLTKSSSQSSLKRNRSSTDVSKRNRSSELQRNSSSTAVNKHKSNKSQVTFDIGMDDPEDEWVDASGSNSPHMSRKGSLINSGQSSLQRNPASNGNSRPETPNESAQPSTNNSPSEKERLRHKEYLTSRVLKRTMSQGATTQMATEMARGSLPRHSPESDRPNGSLSTSGNQEGLTSRFVETPGSGIISDGSFYTHSSSKQLPPVSPRAHSSSSLSQNGSKHFVSDVDNSALVPKAAGRSTGPRAETSRTQQKLNLQRQSSALEPGQAVGAAGGAAGPLIGITGVGYDGASSRDPRVNRLMERTGMEYLVVRRCQNPIARSLNRLGRLPDLEKSKRIPRPGTPLANGKRTTSEAPARHTRNVSMPDPRQAATSRRVATIRSSGAGSSFEGDDAARLSERLSGSSATEETDDTTTLLRNLWEKSMELSASTD